MQMKLVFFWLVQLNPLFDLPTDPNGIKSKIFSDNCSKNNGNISNKVDCVKLLIKEKFIIKEKLKTEEKIERKELEDLE